MSKFCIDLEGMMLPDAIAALVDAWSEAQITEQTTDWVSELRLRIKQKYGKGWIIDAVGKTKLNPNGRCRFTKIAPDRSRTSVVLPYEWLSENAELIYLSIEFLIWENIKRGCTLQDAMSRLDFTK